MNVVVKVALAWAAFMLFLFLLKVMKRKAGASDYRRIKDWLRVKHGVMFPKGTTNATIRMRLEAVLESERMRLKSEEDKLRESGKKVKRPLTNRLKGFEAIIREQDYSFLTE